MYCSDSERTATSWFTICSVSITQYGSRGRDVGEHTGKAATRRKMICWAVPLTREGGRRSGQWLRERPLLGQEAVIQTNRVTVGKDTCDGGQSLQSIEPGRRESIAHPAREIPGPLGCRG